MAYETPPEVAALPDQVLAGQPGELEHTGVIYRFAKNLQAVLAGERTETMNSLVAWAQANMAPKEHTHPYAPASHTHPVSQIEATGTRDETTFLRGDGTWAQPPTGSGGGGVTNHADLQGRNVADQHTMAAITGLTDALAGKAATNHTQGIGTITGVGSSSLPSLTQPDGTETALVVVGTELMRVNAAALTFLTEATVAHSTAGQVTVPAGVYDLRVNLAADVTSLAFAGTNVRRSQPVVIWFVNTSSASRQVNLAGPRLSARLTPPSAPITIHPNGALQVVLGAPDTNWAATPPILMDYVLHLPGATNIVPTVTLHPANVTVTAPNVAKLKAKIVDADEQNWQWKLSATTGTWADIVGDQGKGLIDVDGVNELTTDPRALEHNGRVYRLRGKNTSSGQEVFTNYGTVTVVAGGTNPGTVTVVHVGKDGFDNYAEGTANDNYENQIDLGAAQPGDDLFVFGGRLPGNTTPAPTGGDPDTAANWLQVYNNNNVDAGRFYLWRKKLTATDIEIGLFAMLASQASWVVLRGAGNLAFPTSTNATNTDPAQAIVWGTGRPIPARAALLSPPSGGIHLLAYSFQFEPILTGPANLEELVNPLTGDPRPKRSTALYRATTAITPGLAEMTFGTRWGYMPITVTPA